ncbi:glyoxalase [Catellatospora sp. TT07R-123]|uniref:VOC family protein n=1 Tax=Catellatospora sp. TT07R-123 TaxID=2733863 RepID=UPI001B071AFD|nr:VOC family protein [Catellatospora sp. TT07R-123]GHJ47706.1 glyoxalase [Catellatospora sp. TT07R-123]
MGFQLTIDCAEPDRLVPFWAAALGYRAQDPPAGHASWRDFYLSVGVPAEELGDSDCVDRLVDPTGAGPAIWFQIVPERKTLKNRLHLDVMVGGGRSVPVAVRRERVDAKVAELMRLGATELHRNDDDANGQYGITLADPEGNEFCVA